MKKEVFEININGYVIEKYVAEFDEQGNCLEELEENIITVNPQNGLYRARWTGTVWVEDMPQAEIDALNNAPQEPTEVELLKGKLYTAEQTVAYTSATQQELLELLIEMGVI